MKLLGRDIKLAIFDLDGTLIDSTSLWSKIDRDFFLKRGMDIPPHYNEEIAHVGLDKAAYITKTKYFPHEKEEDIIKEWKDMSLKAYKEDIPLKDNGYELLKILKDNGVKLAIATANSKELYEPCLKRLGVWEFFDFAIDVNSTKEGKNSSEIYDTASSKFGLSSENVVIFEDLYEAIMTSYKAKYLTIAVYDEHSTRKVDEIKSNSHLFIHNFNEVIKLIK